MHEANSRIRAPISWRGHSWIHGRQLPRCRELDHGPVPPTPSSYACAAWARR